MKNPLIEIVVDEMNESKPTFCSPYIWIVTIQNTEGCAVDVDFYAPEQVREKLRDFFASVPSILFRTTFEAIECRLHDIEGEEAIDAITLAIAKYFEDEDNKVDSSGFDIKRDVDFALTTAWDNETDRFTLRTDGELHFPQPPQRL